MLTETLPLLETVSAKARLSQNETLPSDSEITRRVMQIRGSWSVAERLRRRREADNRFADLLDALTGDHTAA